MPNRRSVPTSMYGFASLCSVGLLSRLPITLMLTGKFSLGKNYKKKSTGCNATCKGQPVVASWTWMNFRTNEIKWFAITGIKLHAQFPSLLRYRNRIIGSHYRRLSLSLHLSDPMLPSVTASTSWSPHPSHCCQSPIWDHIAPQHLDRMMASRATVNFLIKWRTSWPPLVQNTKTKKSIWNFVWKSRTAF